MIFTLFACMVIKNWGVVGFFFFNLCIFLTGLLIELLSVIFFSFQHTQMQISYFHIRILKVFLRRILCINLEKNLDVFKSFFNLHFTLNLKKTQLVASLFSFTTQNAINLNSHHSSSVSFVYVRVQKMLFKCSLYRPVFVLDNNDFFLSFIAFFFCDRTNENNYRLIITLCNPGLPAIRQNQPNNQDTGNRRMQDFLFINYFIYFIHFFIFFF